MIARKRFTRAMDAANVRSHLPLGVKEFRAMCTRNGRLRMFEQQVLIDGATNSGAAQMTLRHGAVHVVNVFAQSSIGGIFVAANVAMAAIELFTGISSRRMRIFNVGI